MWKELPSPYFTMDVTRPDSVPPVWKTRFRQTLGTGLWTHSISAVEAVAMRLRSAFVPIALAADGCCSCCCFWEDDCAEAANAVWCLRVGDLQVEKGYQVGLLA